MKNPTHDIEEQLRLLPPPPVPDDLEVRLLARVPPFRPAAAMVRPRPWPARAGLAALAAAVVVAATVWMAAYRQGDSPHRQTSSTAPVAPATETVTFTVLPQPARSETRTCDILPPLPVEAS